MKSKREEKLRKNRIKMRKISIRRKIIMILAAGALGLTISPCLTSARPTSKTWEKAFSIDPSKPVYFHFREVNGDLKVTTSSEAAIRIKATKEALTKDQLLAERLLKATKIQLSQKGNRIEMEIIYPRLRAIFFPFRDYRRIKVTSEISLPSQANLTASLVDGWASLQGKLNQVNLKTVDGSIWTENIEARLNLRTVDGRITIKQGKGEAEISTVDGDVTISGEIEPLKVTTVDGDISIDLSPETKITRAWQLRAVDGRIEMVLPEDISANLNIETYGGSIRCDLRLTLSEPLAGRRILGQLNHGGPLISLKTVDGQVWLKTKRITP